MAKMGAGDPRGSFQWRLKRVHMPLKARRIGSYSIFVIILVVFTVLAGIGGEFFTSFFGSIFPSRVSNISEQGSGKVYFEVSPGFFAKYWRTSSYDLYKDGYWVKTFSDSRNYTGAYIETGVKKYLAVHGYTLQVKVSTYMDVIPTVLNTVRIDQVEPDTTLKIDEYGVVRPARGFIGTYRITYLDYSYSSEMLGQREISIPPEMSNYLSLSGVNPEVISYARKLVKGVPTPFEKMMFLTTHIKHQCTFSLNFSHPPDKDPIAYFLLESRSGGVREFATALALMGRSVDIPTRMVAGFALGNTVDTIRVLTEENIHYWVEAYFGELGWIPFEASPGLGGLSSVKGYDSSVRGGGNGGPRMRITDSPPDLSPVPPYSMPTDLHPNMPFTLYLQINNYGERVLNWFELGIELDFELVVRPVEMTLYPYEEALIPVEITLIRSGPQTGKILLDPNDKQYESNEKNNQILVVFNVVSGIDLHIGIDRTSVKNGRIPYNEEVMATIRITNMGDLNAYLVTVVLKCGANFTQFFNLSSIMGNSYQEMNVNLPRMPEGVYTLSGEVDPQNTIHEFNETNNLDEMSLTVVPRFEIVSILWVDETGDAAFGPGDTVQVQVKSNLFSWRVSVVRIREVDPHGELMANLTLQGGCQGTLLLVIDHIIPDITEAEFFVEEL